MAGPTERIGGIRRFDRAILGGAAAAPALVRALLIDSEDPTGAVDRTGSPTRRAR